MSLFSIDKICGSFRDSLDFQEPHPRRRCFNGTGGLGLLHGTCRRVQRPHAGDSSSHLILNDLQVTQPVAMSDNIQCHGRSTASSSGHYLPLLDRRGRDRSVPDISPASVMQTFCLRLSPVASAISENGSEIAINRVLLTFNPSRRQLVIKGDGEREAEEEGHTTREGGWSWGLS